MVDLNSFPGLTESRKVSELKDKEKDVFTKVIIGFIILIILSVILIISSIMLRDPNFYVGIFYIFLLLLIFLGMIIGRLRGTHYFVGTFSLSERYKFYLDGLVELIKKYNTWQDKKTATRQLKSCLISLYELTTISRRRKRFNDLFLNDVEVYNQKLKSIILRLNGFIGYVEKQKRIPGEVVTNLQTFSYWINQNSTKLEETQTNRIDAIIDYLNNNHPNVIKLDFFNPVLPKIAERVFYTKKTFFKAFITWILIVIVYLFFVTFIIENLSNEVIFQNLIIVMVFTPPVIYLIFRNQ